MRGLTFTLLLISELLLVSFFLVPRFLEDETFKPPVEKFIQKKSTPTTIYFVGDIMLARGVEWKMEESGRDFPFKGMRENIMSADLSVGNFEGTVPLVHVPTPSLNMQFPVTENNFKTLSETGFDILSLANNHSNDHGESALFHTRDLRSHYTIVCGGRGYGFDSMSIATTSINGTRFGFLFLHTVWTQIDESVLSLYINKLIAESDIQISYIHWGEEYMLTHSAEQERLATKLIDLGIDAVIGHHPHVIQDIGLYRGKPIFYSLGNFVFDQYFNSDVQEGLTVLMHIEDETISYSLIPVTSKSTRNQPWPMNDEDAKRIVQRTLYSISHESGVDIEKGTILVKR